MASKARVEKEVRNICKAGLQTGEVQHITVKYLIKTVSEELKCETADVAAHKQHIKDLASRLLNEEAEEPAAEAPPEISPDEVTQESEDDIEEVSKASMSKGKRKQAVAASSDDNEEASEEEEVVLKPKKKASRKAAESEDEIEVVKEPAKKKRKSSEKPVKATKSTKAAKATFKSAEFINSEGDPISAPAAPSDEEAAPPKKKKRTSKAKDGGESTEKPKKEKETKPKAKKAPTGDEDEEVTRLKGFVKACGVRFMQKEIADMSVKEQQKYLKAKLADLGMTGRLSAAKAKEIKAKRELDKEMADLQASGAPDVEASTGRKTRNLRQKDEDEGWVRKKPKTRVADSDEEESSEEAELDEKTKRKVDKQTKRNVNAFFGSVGGVKGLLGDLDML